MHLCLLQAARTAIAPARARRHWHSPHLPRRLPSLPLAPHAALRTHAHLKTCSRRTPPLPYHRRASRCATRRCTAATYYWDAHRKAWRASGRLYNRGIWHRHCAPPYFSMR